MKSEKNSQYIMTKDELHRLQRVQLELINEVKRICDKHNIKFNMVGGTMLGAIRHKGYIPWDDDADIGFLRSEYDRFLDVCKTELDENRFYVQDCRYTQGYRWGYGKLRRKGTAFVRLGQEHMPYEQCVSIDLMPFDGVPDQPIMRKIHFFKCFCYRKLFWSSVGKTTEKSKLIRVWYQIISRIPEKIVYGSYQRFINKSNRYNTKLVRILTFPTPKKCYGYDRRWYEELTNYQFEDIELPGAIDYDGYLKVKYGNYMELPPEEKRKIHPISKLKLLEE